MVQVDPQRSSPIGYLRRPELGGVPFEGRIRVVDFGDTPATGKLPRSNGVPGLQHLQTTGLGQGPRELSLLLGAKKALDAPSHRDSHLVRVVFWNLGGYRTPDPELDGPTKSEKSGERGSDPLARKTDKLVEGLRIAGRDRPPDFCFVAEIEGPELAERLARHPGLKEAGYNVASLNLDDYPMTNAILSRYPMVGRPKLHKVHSDDETPTRGILEATYDVAGHPLTVFVNHWPSKRGGEAAAEQRERISAQLKQMIRERQALHPGAEILVVGDFNSHLDESVFGREFLNAVVDKDAVLEDPKQEALFHTIADIAEKTFGTPFDSLEQIAAAEEADGEALGTHVYKNAWRTLDGIILNQGLLDDQGLRYLDGSAEIIRHPKLLYKGRRPNREISDHVPTAATLEILGQPVRGDGRLKLRAPTKSSQTDRPAFGPGRSGHGVPFPPLQPEAYAEVRGPARLDAVRLALQLRMVLSFDDVRAALTDQIPSSLSLPGPHPFGVVDSVVWSGGGAKVGPNAQGQMVFEPPDDLKAPLGQALLALQATMDLPLSDGEAQVVQAWAGDAGEVDTRKAAVRSVQKRVNPFVGPPQALHAFGA